MTGQHYTPQKTNFHFFHFLIRCCLFHHFIIHIWWYTENCTCWIVVIFTACNTDLLPPCSQHPRCPPPPDLSVPGCTSQRGKLVQDFSITCFWLPDNRGMQRLPSRRGGGGWVGEGESGIHSTNVTWLISLDTHTQTRTHARRHTHAHTHTLD